MLGLTAFHDRSWVDPRECLQDEVESVTWKETNRMRSCFPEEQALGILKEHGAGAKTADLCPEHPIGEATFYNWNYNWKRKFGHPGAS